MRRVGGLLPSPVDPRDWPSEDLLGARRKLSTPQDASLRSYVDSVLDQGNTESCVGNAVAQAVRVLMRARGTSAAFLPSRLMVYYNSRAVHGGTTSDVGTYMRAALASIQKLGFCSEEVWPFDESKINKKPSWNAYRKGIHNRVVNGYYAIKQKGDARVERVKTAILDKRPIVFGMRIDRAFEQATGSNVIGVPTGDIIGGHAMCIIGYDAEGVDVVNSWGTSWGDQGYGKLSWDVVAWEKAIDFYVVTMVKS